MIFVQCVSNRNGMIVALLSMLGWIFGFIRRFEPRVFGGESIGQVAKDLVKIILILLIYFYVQSNMINLNLSVCIEAQKSKTEI